MPNGNSNKQTTIRVRRSNGIQIDAAACGTVTAAMTAAYPVIPRLQIGQWGRLAAWTLHSASAPAQRERQPHSNIQSQILMKNRQVTANEIATGTSRSLTIGL